MKRKPTPFFSLAAFMFFLLLLVVPSIHSLFGQTISPQKLPFNAICAGGPHSTIPNAVFNEYQAQFKISGFDPSVTFIVELSDPTGSFAVPTATTPLAPLNGTPPDTATDKTLTFAVPTNIVGSNNYQLRVKSSTGVVSGSFTIFGTVSTKSFPVYFKAYNESFYIADKNSTVSFCSGSSLTLSVYNPTPADPSSSPANFPQLKYNWYKDGNLISGQSTASLVVNTAGLYYAELNYGPCTDVNFRSQGVTVASFSGSGGGAAITSSLGNPFCGSEMTTLTAPAGISYTWSKDGVKIPQASNQTYQVNVPGVYTCDVNFGSCSATATIDLKGVGTVNANGNAVVEGEILSIAQGETLSVTTTTTVSNPTYQWYLNNVAIQGASQSALDITVSGNYKVMISGCAMSFVVKYSSIIDYNVPKISNILTPEHPWIIPEEYAGGKANIMIFNSYGEIVYQTDNYDNYNGWPQTAIDFKNFNPVYYYIITPTGGSAKKGSITLVK